MERIKIKYLRDIPKLKKIREGDWIDLYCGENTFLCPNETRIIPLGVAMQLPEGYEAIVVPRSSTFRIYGILMTNSIGVIDNRYCGNDDEWGFPCLATNHTFIPRGARIAQFRIIKNQPEIEFETVDFLTGANRGGFGSTGK